LKRSQRLYATPWCPNSANITFAWLQADNHLTAGAAPPCCVAQFLEGFSSSALYRSH
jgi:hypothetical protein